jgi:hypothetical protein
MMMLLTIGEKISIQNIPVGSTCPGTRAVQCHFFSSLPLANSTFGFYGETSGSEIDNTKGAT